GPAGSAFERVLAVAFAGRRLGAIPKKVLLGTAAAETDLHHLRARASGLVTAGPALFLPGAVGSSTLPAYRRHTAAFPKVFPEVPSSQIGGFDVAYFNAMSATLKALAGVHGDLSAGEQRFMAALSRVQLDAPNGHISLDARHRAIGPNYVWQLQG